jgi:hypothetical protein
MSWLTSQFRGKSLGFDKQRKQKEVDLAQSIYIQDRPFTLMDFRTLQTKLTSRGWIHPVEYSAILARLKKYPLELPDDDFGALDRKRVAKGKLPPHEYLPYRHTNQARTAEMFRKAEEQFKKEEEARKKRKEEEEVRRKEEDFPPGLTHAPKKAPVTHWRRGKRKTNYITIELNGFGVCY